jgi:hypothetical protein
MQRRGVAIIITSVIIAICLGGSILLRIPQAFYEILDVSIHLVNNNNPNNWENVIEGFPIMPNARSQTNKYSYVDYYITASQAEVEAYYVRYYCMKNYDGIIELNITNPKSKYIVFQTPYWDIYLTVNYIEENQSHVFLIGQFSG